MWYLVGLGVVGFGVGFWLVDVVDEVEVFVYYGFVVIFVVG